MTRRYRAQIAPQRFLATVLFTDIVGSTERAVELGDRRWRELLERHHSVVRRQLARFGGREIDTAGDGFFAAFAGPAQAIVCARSIVASIHDIGVEVRAGLHMGECEVVGDKIGGIAVHIGARVAARAGAGEVLTTGTVQDLVRGSGIEFEDRGVTQLKGVPGDWHIYAVTDASAVEEAALSERSRRAAAALPMRGTASGRSRTRRRAMTFVAASVAVALGVTFVLTRGGSTSSLRAIAANSIGRIDPGSGSVVDQVTVGARPAGVAFGAGSLWVTNEGDGTVTQIDPTTAAVRDTIQAGTHPTGIAVTGHAVWIASSEEDSVYRFDPKTRTVDPIKVGNGPSAMAVGGGYVWVANTLAATVARIAPATERVESFDLPYDRPAGLAYGSGALWVSSQSTAILMRLDATSGEVVQAIHVGNGASAVAVGAGAVWVANSLDGTVSRVDPKSNAVTATIPVGNGPDSVAVGHDAVWVSNRFARTLSKIEPSSGHVTDNVNVQNAPRGLAFAGDSLWVAAAGTPTGEHIGGTLRVGMQETFGSIDPARGYSPQAWMLLPLTNDGLLTFQRVGGREGSLVVPDLAVAIPTPSDGATTYTFQLRPGIHYSTGEPVRASDFRYALERIFKVRSPRPDFYAGILGGAQCLEDAKSCDLSKGVDTDDARGTVTIRLRAPDPEFLYKLALPFAAAVPPSVPDKPLERAFPATGPYRIASYDAKKLLVLERNPRFHVWSAAAQPEGVPDQIEIRIGISPGRQADLVAEGKLDLAADSPPTPRLHQLEVTAGERLHDYVQDATSYFSLNTLIPPFDNLKARRAVNYAADRSAIGDPFSSDFEPTCQVLPATVPGFEPYCPYTIQPEHRGRGPWIAPDLAKARRLVKQSGTAGEKVVVWAGESQIVLAEKAATMLRQLGYRATSKSVPDAKYFPFMSNSANHVQMAPTGWLADYPAPATFLDSLLSCDKFTPNSPGNLNSGGFCDRALDRVVRRAEGLQLTNPAAAVKEWARADRLATDAAPWLFLDNPRGADFLSTRTGGYQRNPEYGVLLDQLFVR